MNLNLKAKLNLKSKTIIGIGLFVVINIILFTVASLFDLEISKILAAGALAEGEYLATDFFGVFGEFIGSAPIFFLIGFAMCALALCVHRFMKLEILKNVLRIVLVFGSMIGFWFLLDDFIKYILEHALVSDAGSVVSPFEGRPAVEFAMYIGQGFFAAIFTTMTFFGLRGISDDTAKGLGKMVVVSLIAVAASFIMIFLLKETMSRIRFRTMNWAEGNPLMAAYGFDSFMNWYESGAKPSAELLKLFPDKDVFMSFPSGHTCAAAASYALILVPSAFKLKKKWMVAACWSTGIIFTGLVALSRIVCGAHFMSDVLFSGTMMFTFMIIVREIFYCKGKHIKVLFNKYEEKPEEIDYSEIPDMTV